MEKLRAYLKSLPSSEQESFARRCGTTLGYLLKAIAVDCKRMGGDLVIEIDRESGGAVSCEELRPDIDWSYLRTGVSSRSPDSPRRKAAPCTPSPRRRRKAKRKSKRRVRKSKRRARPAAVDSSSAGATV